MTRSSVSSRTGKLSAKCRETAVSLPSFAYRRVSPAPGLVLDPPFCRERINRLLGVIAMQFEAADKRQHYRFLKAVGSRIAKGEGPDDLAVAFRHMLWGRVVGGSKVLALGHKAKDIENENRVADDAAHEYERQLAKVAPLVLGKDPLSRIVHVLWTLERWSGQFAQKPWHYLPHLWEAIRANPKDRELWSFAREIVDGLSPEQLAHATKFCKPKEDKNIGRMRDRVLWHLKQREGMPMCSKAFNGRSPHR